MSRIGIIVGSTRDKAAGQAVGEWVNDLAQGRENGVEYQLLELKEFNVPILTSEVVPGAANKQYDDANVQEWSKAVDACDGFVFVTPEYNHSVPGAFKNAYDSLGAEWAGKPVAFVGYGSVGGVRAVEAWRNVVANFSMPQLRNQLDFHIFTDWNDGEFRPSDDSLERANSLLAELEDAL
ncbi:NADPH-dependent FMN reductase [Corynebacterium accolens]|uniref:NADPH-dependent FMN reductase n=1 Tax=Corynebacterium accolens TaxID=38284 RepID=UPI00254A6E2E|nr:NAD(P)H-dependent oxidoreductase [Corynebacterium accolens]MDK8504950.1 NAD(P)H-dependent oxidoreductase [Corynebacterium accolens]MDK8662051.1 NAD(P)H-dependent oxidoreductase [Corynebacterium accolens]